MTIFLIALIILEFSAICVMIANQLPKTTGVMHLVETDDVKSFTLEFDEDPNELKNGSMVLFRVQEEADRG